MDAAWGLLWDRLPSLMNGLTLTIALSISSLVVAFILGLVAAWAQLSGRWLPLGLAKAYTIVIRGVPEIVLMLFLFYGGQILLNEAFESFGAKPLEINPFAAGVLVLGFIYGAYMGESLRGGWLAIPPGQIEAAKSFGFSPWLLFKRIIFPQLMRYALPGIGNNWAVLIKATAVVSLIGLQDMVWYANVAGKTTRQPFTFMLAVLVIYLLLNSLSETGLAWLTRRYGRGFASPTTKG